MDKPLLSFANFMVVLSCIKKSSRGFIGVIVVILALTIGAGVMYVFLNKKAEAPTGSTDQNATTPSSGTVDNNVPTPNTAPPPVITQPIPVAPPMVGSKPVIQDASSVYYRRDQQRFSDLGEIELGLALYYDKYNKFPDELLPLAKSNFLYGHDGRTIKILPTDPLTHRSYSYAISPDKQKYHLGATVEQEAYLVNGFKTSLLRSPDTSLAQSAGYDKDFNSKAVGWKNGFDGSDQAKCSVQDTGVACMDHTE